MSQVWLAQSERGSIVLARFVVWLTRHAGRAAVRLLLYPITAYFFLTSRQSRRASYDYLARVLPDRPSRRDVFDHFFHFAATILDRVFLWSGRPEAFEIETFDPDRLVARLRRGQGCLLIGAHLGSFDMLRMLAVDHDRLKLKVLMRAEHNSMITGVLAALNPEIAKTLQPMRGPSDALRLRELLQAGYMVALLGDRSTPGDRLIEAQFLGGAASFPATPIQLAGTLDVPVFTFFGLFRGGRRYEAYFDLLAERISIPRAARDEAVRFWVQAYADRLAHYVRLAPFNWFNFFPFWRA